MLGLAVPEESHSFVAERCSERPGAVKGAFFAAKRTLYGEDRSERMPLEGMGTTSPDSLQIGRLPTRKPEYPELKALPRPILRVILRRGKAYEAGREAVPRLISGSSYLR